MGKSIFITGICGFIGSNVANKLVKLGYNVFGCDNLQFGFRDNVDKGVTWIEQDFDLVDHKILNKFDVLLHIATANIIFGIDNPIETFRTNALDSIHMIQNYHGKVVYTSTSSVYGNAKFIPTREDSGYCVSNAYDQSKLILERYLMLRRNYTTLRLSNVYGPNQRPENPYCGVIGKFIDAAFKHQPMKINGDGSATRDFTFIDDVVDAIILAINFPALNTEINIGTGIETSTIELAKIIGEVAQVGPVIEYIPSRAIDGIKRRCLDITKAKQLLHWEPLTLLREGIEKTIFYT